MMQDASVIQNIPLIICNADAQQDSRITGYTSFEYTERWGARDSFTLSIPRAAPYAEQLLPGRIMIIPADRHHDDMRAVLIKQIKVDGDTIQVSGNDYVWDLLDARIVLAGTATDTGTDTQTNVAAETAARHYIVDNITDGKDGHGTSYPARQDPIIILEAVHTPALGAPVTVEGRLQTVAKIVESICEQSGHVDSGTELPRLGVYGVVVEDASPRGWHIEVRFRVGADHSQTQTNPDVNWVVLSEAYHNIRISEYSNTLSENVMLVAGTGKASARIMKTVGDLTLTGVSRREKFVSASDCKTTDEMDARGKEEIEKAKSLTISAELVNPYIYGMDFKLGDIVTVDMGIYGAYNIRVSEVTTVYTADGIRVDVTLGAELEGIVSVIRDAVEATPLRRE